MAAPALQNRLHLVHAPLEVGEVRVPILTFSQIPLAQPVGFFIVFVVEHGAILVPSDLPRSAVRDASGLRTASRVDIK